MIDLTGAACRGHDPRLWFADPKSADYKQALDICAGCPIRAACLEHVLTMEGDTVRNGRYGIAGGLTPTERASHPRATVPVRAPCGTHAAARAHARRGEPICAACAEATRVYRRGLAARARAA